MERLLPISLSYLGDTIYLYAMYNKNSIIMNIKIMRIVNYIASLLPRSWKTKRTSQKRGVRKQAKGTGKKWSPVMLSAFAQVAAKEVSEATAANYRTAVRAFIAFHQGRDIALASLSKELVSRYERWLRERGCCRNTVSCYLRSMRAIYNKAVQRKTVRNLAPFRGLFTGNELTEKPGLSEREIRRLWKLELPEGSFLALTRDLFLFSFCVMGMSPIDLAHLRRGQIKGGAICYCRHKTGRQVRVKLEPYMLQIIRKYERKETDYAFSIFTRTSYASFLSRYNRVLKRLAQRAGIRISLSAYTARHSWAKIANQRNVPLTAIAAALGHSNTRTTLFYIMESTAQITAKANKKLLKEIFCAPLRKRWNNES